MTREKRKGTANTYFTTSERRDGKVERSYIGNGPVAQLTADFDQAVKHMCDDRHATRQAERRAWGQADRLTRELTHCASLVGQAMLLLAGFRQHARGLWRRSREQTKH